MVYRIEFFELKYPRGYKPGDNYKKTMIAQSWITDYTRSIHGLENAIWSRAAHCKITSKVTNFRIYDFGETNCFLCGSIL